MTQPRPHAQIQPRLLRRERAAVYLDVSPTTFDKLVRDGLLPAPKRLHSMKVWDRVDLDQCADMLPYEGAAPLDTTWDD